MTGILGILIALVFVIGLPGIITYILVKWIRALVGLSTKELKYRACKTLDMFLAIALAVALAAGSAYLLSNKIISVDYILVLLVPSSIILISFIIYSAYKRENSKRIQDGISEPAENRNERNLMLKFCALLVALTCATQAMPTYALIIIAICLALRYLSQEYSGKWHENKQKEKGVAKSLPEMLNTPRMTFVMFFCILGTIGSHVLLSTPDKNIKLCNELDKTNLDANIQACTVLISKNHGNSTLYLMRASAYLNKGLIDEAMEDAKHSLNIAPDNHPGVALRGIIYLAQGKCEDSIYDMDKAIQSNYTTDNKIISTLFSVRGAAELCTLSLEPAINDLRASLQQDPDDDLKSYTTLLLHIARLRAGQDDKEFNINSASLSKGKWPAPLIALYRGEGSIEEVFSKAKAGNTTERADQLCDFNFYIAEFYLLNGMKGKAQPLFEAARDNCSKINFERSLAQAELKLLNNNTK